jgi:hypothetical protein
VPPVAVSFCEYATVASPVGSGEVVETVNGATMTSVNCRLAVTSVASVNWTVKLEVPAALGAPVIVPVVDSDNPPGRLPLEMAQLYGMVPPEAESACE